MKNPIFLNVSIITGTIVFYLISLLIDKGASYSLLVIYISANIGVREVFGSRECEINKKHKKTLYVLIILMYIILIYALIMYMKSFETYLDIIFGIVIGGYSLLIVSYFHILFSIKDSNTNRF